MLIGILNSSAQDSLSDVQEARQPPDPHWQVIGKFAVHTVVGTLIFSVIATPAIVLDLCIQWLKTVHVQWLANAQVSEEILVGLKGAAHLIFAADLILLIVFLCKTTFRTAKHL
jgi:hypothetical protein